MPPRLGQLIQRSAVAARECAWQGPVQVAPMNLPHRSVFVLLASFVAIAAVAGCAAGGLARASAVYDARLGS